MTNANDTAATEVAYKAPADEFWSAKLFRGEPDAASEKVDAFIATLADDVDVRITYDCPAPSHLEWVDDVADADL